MTEHESPKQTALEELEEHLKAGRYRDAIQMLHTLSGMFPENTDYLVLLGRCYLKIGSPLNALLSIQKRGPSHSGSQDLLELLRVIYEHLYLIDQSMQLARHLIKLGTATEDAYLSYTRFLLENEQTVEAAEVLREGLTKYPSSEGLKFSQGILHVRLQEIDEATALAGELRNSGSALASDLSKIIEKGYHRAIEELKAQGVEKSGEFLKKATQFMTDGNLQGAAHALIASLRADRKNALSYTRLGYVYDGYGLFEEGLGLHSKAIALDPSLVEAYRNLGYSYHKGGKFREAIDTYGKALEFDPDNVDVHNNLGVVYDTLGNYEKGMEHFRHSLKIDPKREDTWRNLGYVYQAQGLVDDAIAAYRSAMKVNPRSPSRLQLATLYRVLHQYKEAKKELLAIVKDKPESVAAWLELAICYKELKQKKKFSETFEKAKALHAKTPSEAFTRGQLMEMLDERAAVDCWTAYLAMAGEVPHEAKRYQYAQERRDALMRKLGMAPPPAHIIELEPSPPEEAK